MEDPDFTVMELVPMLSIAVPIEPSVIVDLLEITREKSSVPPTVMVP